MQVPSLDPELSLRDDSGGGLTGANSANIGKQEKAALTRISPRVTAEEPILSSAAQDCADNDPRKPDQRFGHPANLAQRERPKRAP
jgi:hypothetical protein